MCVGKQITIFKKPYQIGILRIVTIQKRESSPAKKCLLQCANHIWKLRTKDVFHWATYKNGRVMIVEKCKY